MPEQIKSIIEKEKIPTSFLIVSKTKKEAEMRGSFITKIFGYYITSPSCYQKVLVMKYKGIAISN